MNLSTRLAAISLLSCLLAPISYASLLNDTIGGSLEISAGAPGINFFTTSSAVVGSGDEFVSLPAPGVTFSADFDSDSLIFSIVNATGGLIPAFLPPGGHFILDFTGLDWTPLAGRIIGLAVTLDELSTTGISFTDNSIHFEVPDLSLDIGETKSVSMNILTQHDTPAPPPSGVPTVSTLALMLLAGFGLLRRRVTAD